MEVRDAVEADADALSDLADAPADVMRGVVHDRTVRVVEDAGDTSEVDDSTSDQPQAEAGSATDREDVEESAEESVSGFVSFDARSETVYVTQLAGETSEVCSRLLEEPRRFADCEEMAVEFVIEETNEAAREAARAEGFEAVGPGPRFEGEKTTRFRLEPS
jgi:hypothetical protein